MTELKKNNKRSLDTNEKKPAVKKFKPSTPSSKEPGKDGKQNFEKKKFGKFSDKNGGGKFQGKSNDKAGGEKFNDKAGGGKFNDKAGGKFKGKFNSKPGGKFNNKPGAKAQSQPQQTEKTNWSELKQKKKELKIQRKKNKTKDLYDVDVKAKKLYEELKMKSTKGNKEQLCQQLHDTLKNADYSKLSLSPDRARIIQMLLKKAPQKIKTEIAEKLIPHITDVALSKYGKFCVSRLMLYCGKDVREKAVNALLSNIVKLTSHAFSSALIDAIYLNHATPDQKLFMKQEFYSDLYKNDKNRGVKTLKDTWTGSEMLRNGILNSTKMNLLKIVSKNLVDNSLVHAVLLEYLEEAGEQDRNEIITAFIPHLAAISSTKQGSRAAVLCYLYSVAKERRAMLKAIKEHVTKLCIHEHGHLLILEVLNSTDDTLNIKKTLFAPMVSDIETIVSSEYGKRVIMFIVSPKTEFFHPKALESLNDDLKLGTQKKDTDIRRKELSDGVTKELAQAIKNNPSFWLKGGHTARVTLAILQSIGSADSEVFDALCSIVCDPNWMVHENEVTTQDEPEPDPKDTGKIKKKKKNPIEVVKEKKEPVMVKGIEHSGLHMAIKKIAKLEGFGKSFAGHFTGEIMEHWIEINRACFVIVEVLEHSDAETKEELKKTLTKHKSLIQKQSHSGAKVLLKNL